MPWSLPWYWNPIIIVVGIIIGWYLNIFIQRYPRGESLLYLPYCPRCRHPISLRNNLPVVSYFLLKGRCADCEERISLRYPIVEILTALILFYFFRNLGLRNHFFFRSIFYLNLMTIAFIDLETEKIPFPLVIGGSIIGVVYSIFGGSILSSLFGFFFGWGIIYLIYFIGIKTEKREVIGNREMFLAGMIGSMLGLRHAIIAIFIGALLAIIYGIKFKKSEVPFGPFLALGAVIGYLYADSIISLVAPFLSIIP